MTDETPSESRRPGSSLSWILWSWMGLFVIYPLSTGPVVSLCLAIDGPYSGGSMGWKTVEVVYAPLILLSEEFLPVANFLEWYLGFWGLF